ncbi:MAG: Acetyltransferase domain [Actinomycetota bacterium]|jgi:N-acetylglutamate synthase-like GNAT family acetyltransferase|nr:Acetyltransferase domain [Actinomycetota bacterium]
MFITRATRHDADDIVSLLATNEWDDDFDPKKGKSFIARDGSVIGHVQMVEVGPQTVVIDQVLVHPERRGSGIGTQLLQGAMNSIGGKLFLCCHEERIPFYERLGFELLPNGYDDAPESVQGFWREVDDYPTAPDHVHFFMTAR